MDYSIKIGQVMGIPIKLNITFLLILPFFAFAFAVNPPPFGFSDVSNVVLRYAFGTLAAVLLFASVLVHEIAHSYVAKQNGLKIAAITLFLFGGISSMEEEPKNPRVEWRMALAGPLTSIIIGVLLGAAYIFVPGLGSITAIGTLVLLLAYMNIVLGIFNLLPGFPMDGGRVLRALLAEHMPYLKATRIAVDVGKAFAVILGLFGLLLGFSGIWLILIALFIYMGASQEGKATFVTTALEGVKVKDIMTKDVITVNPDTTIAECIDNMLHQGHLGYPVMEDGKVIGVVTLDEASNVPADKRKEVKVKDVMSRDVYTVSPDDDAMVALQRMSTHRIGRLIVEYHGKLTGIISQADLVRALKLFTAMKSQH
jgi:Zn-dependent protease/CBS domain-containing protein